MVIITPRSLPCCRHHTTPVNVSEPLPSHPRGPKGCQTTLYWHGSSFRDTDGRVLQHICRRQYSHAQNLELATKVVADSYGAFHIFNTFNTIGLFRSSTLALMAALPLGVLKKVPRRLRLSPRPGSAWHLCTVRALQEGGKLARHGGVHSPETACHSVGYGQDGLRFN